MGLGSEVHTVFKTCGKNDILYFKFLSKNVDKGNFMNHMFISSRSNKAAIENVKYHGDKIFDQ